jgi:hypothetical protein
VSLARRQKGGISLTCAVIKTALSNNRLIKKNGCKGGLKILMMPTLIWINACNSINSKFTYPPPSSNENAHREKSALSVK